MRHKPPAVQALIGHITLAQMNRPTEIPPVDHLATTIASCTDDQVRFLPHTSLSHVTSPKHWFLLVSWFEHQYGVLQVTLEQGVSRLPQQVVQQVAAFCAWLLHLDERPSATAHTSTFILPDFAARFITLTPREKEILRHCGNGLDNRAIAQIMNITANTVKTHRRHVYEKLDIHNDVEALEAGRKAQML